MPQITLLSQETIDKIAAGEVVERPSSVVKELVENAIDARATAVTVEIKEGGTTFVRITDNGCGIEREQVPLAFLRHSTSKIKSVEDLLCIHSLGFRGEALSSIAAVSQVELITKTYSDLTGTRYVIEGSREMSNDEIGAPDGTTFIVRNLFYNTPARKKFLKTAQTEGNYISDLMERLALSHPDVSFKFISNGQTKMHTSGNSNEKDLIYHIYGRDITAALLPVCAETEYFSVKGFVGKPMISRGNRSYESYFINGRYIKSALLSKAVEEAYKGFMMQHQYPFCVLYFTMDTELLDVNVHPTKQEVRISKERELMALISQAIANALKEQDLIPDALENLAKSTIRRAEKPVQTTLPLKENRLYYDRESQDFKLRPEVADPQRPLTDEATADSISQENPVEKPTSAIKFAERKAAVYDELDHPELDLASLDKAYDKLEGEEASTFPELEYFGQMHGTYLFAQDNGGLYIIDQHAAQERVKYEEYRESIGDVDGSQQQLLVPYIFEFPADDLIRLQQRKHLLEEVGVYLEEYGVNQLILREHPIWMKEEEIESGIYEMCDMLLLTKEVSIKKYRAELAIMMSCKRSIKANHTLDDYSARDLIYQLSQCDNPYNCPHGRPVLVNFTKSDMEKMFRRIQENHTSLRELGKY